jgi:signal transduction histidine kinase
MNSARILIVDDHPDVCQDFVKILNDRSSSNDELGRLEAALLGKERTPKNRSTPAMEVEVSCSGEIACQMVQRARAAGRPFSVAFVDMRMPGGWDGLRTIEALWRADASLQIVICTAHSDVGWDEIIDRLGVSDQLLILHKPVHPIEVRQLACALSVKWSMREERERAQALLIQSSKLAAVGQLAAGVAHEINNPLAVILGFAQALERRLPADDPLRPLATPIVRESLRCKSIIQALLTFSRAPKQALDEIDVRALIDSTLDLIGSRARLQNTRIVLDLSADLPLIRGNRTQIEQVLVNLANNALDAISQGGEIVLRARADEPTGGIFFAVDDHGPGIPEAIRSRIFEPFFTTKDVGKGTGLGLSLSYEIVQQHGGRIDVESEVGRGTTVIVHLPSGIPGREPISETRAALRGS